MTASAPLPLPLTPNVQCESRTVDNVCSICRTPLREEDKAHIMAIFA